MVAQVQPAIWQRLLIGMLLVLALGAGSLPQPTQARGPADVALVLLPAPNVFVTPDGIITYELKVQNFGRGGAYRVLVEMPYDPQLVRVLDTTFEHPDDWVGSVGPDRVRLFFEEVQGSGTVRKAFVRMQVQPDVPHGTVINMWAGYGWDGANGGGQGYSSNAAPVVVLGEELALPYVWLAVDPPAAPVGTQFNFYTNRLLPYEAVEVTLVAPWKTRRIEDRSTVNAQGEFWFQLGSNRLAPAVYTLNIRGTRSNLTASVTFRVTE